MNEFLGRIATLDARWQELADPVAKLSLLSLKAEVHLGKNVKEATEDLLRLVRELQITYEQYVDVTRPEEGFGPEDFDEDARKVLWSKPTGDTFYENVEKAVKHIDDLTRRHL
jgi:hypothetical protein